MGGRKEKQCSVGYLCVDIKYGIIPSYCICVCRVFFQMWVTESVVQSVLGRELLYLTHTKTAGSTLRCFAVEFRCPPCLSRRSSLAPRSSPGPSQKWILMSLMSKGFRIFCSYAVVLADLCPQAAALGIRPTLQTDSLRRASGWRKS